MIETYSFPSGPKATPRGLSPSDIQGAYDTAPLFNAGTNGAGQTIAIAGFADYSASNIAAYDQQYGLPNDGKVIADERTAV